MPWDEYYELVSHYMAEDAKAALSREIPKIESAIDRRVAEWAKGVGEFIDKEVLTELKDQEKLLNGARQSLKGQLEALTQSTGKTTKLKKTAAELLTAIDDYESKWRGVGEKIRAQIKTAAGSLGIPLP